MFDRDGVFDADAGLVLAGDFLHDGQAQTRTISLRTEHAVEGLEHALALGNRECRGLSPPPATPGSC